MSKEHQLPSDSDDDDEDYVPDGADNEPVSEADSEGEVESGPEDENDENKRETDKKTSKKRGKQTDKDKSTKRRKRTKRKLKDTDESKEAEEENESKDAEKKELTEEEEKKRADSLWADFMKDTAPVVPKQKPQNPTNGPREKSPVIVKPKVEEKVKITKVFEFAGEEVKIEKEVPVDSAEARLSLSSAENSAKTDASTSPGGGGRGRGRGIKRGGLGGISSVLGQIGKKAKISTLEKSKLDWDSYKKQENLEEEITTHNRGKDGYLERQDFLQRADLRQFEIEKQLRNSNRRSTR
ncbi:hypothetical protein KPH14_007540 [Odynerus spinipes]|uniref:Craniofacial development protein 1 n=1 Tax=Odynerus spinipes TaxID=1348599 RepID=A0AAD9VN62_9HYME|nr:hypothetical protein KPH14_007540 [Odynerus spinipes]